MISFDDIMLMIIEPEVDESKGYYSVNKREEGTAHATYYDILAVNLPPYIIEKINFSESFTTAINLIHGGNIFFSGVDGKSMLKIGELFLPCSVTLKQIQFLEQYKDQLQDYIFCVTLANQDIHENCQKVIGTDLFAYLYTLQDEKQSFKRRGHIG